MPAMEGPLNDGNSNHAIKLMDRVYSSLIALMTVDDAQMIEDSIELAREANALTTENSAYKVEACWLLVESLRHRFSRNSDDALLEEMITLGREALTLSPEGHPDWASLCENLGISLWTCYERTSNVALLDEAIDLQRKALHLCPEEHPNRSASCGNLAISLKTRHQRTSDVGLLDEVIDLERKALDLYSAEHPGRSLSCGNLAISLKTRYQSTGDVGLLEEAINLEREAHDICPVGHPYRSTSCEALATSLMISYNRTGDVHLADEAINLEREALGLRPVGHTDRSVSCTNLAASLMARYTRTGDVGLLDEAINIQREALDLNHAGHPGRAISCGNLATSLTAWYKRTNDVDLLDEAINLQREALDLCPSGHSYRSISRGNLANSLQIRHQNTGDVGLSDEAIDLEREALDLRPEGHTDRSVSCTNLAASLMARYKRTGDVGLLDEAINIQREALDLNHAGHPGRAISCGNLATSLTARYKRTNDVDFLDEATNLQREALDLRPVGHPERSISCGNLAGSLITCYNRTGDVALLRESLTLLQESVLIAPVHAVWRYLHDLTYTYLLHTSPSYDVSKAISYLSQSLERDPDNTLAFVRSLLPLLDHLWQCNLEGKHIQLITIYQRFANLLPLLVHPALGLQPQLQALKTCTGLGSDAFINATLANNWLVGLETLELAQGVVWSTNLHRRDPQLNDVPKQLASKLQRLLQSLAIGLATEPDHEERKSLSPRDLLHIQSSQAHAVIEEIRALPGLDRFMMGETFETLRTAASNHPVAVLVGARGHYHALIMAPSIAKQELISLDLNAEDEMALSFPKGSLRQSRGGIIDVPGVERGLKLSTSSPANALERQCKVLWEKAVKPVLDKLDLRPSGSHHRPRLHWCLTGIFSTLPLHAAGIYHGSLAHRVCCADFVVSSYTPTITTLLRGQKATTSLRHSDLCVALVAEKRAQDTNFPVIYDVDTEIEHIAAVVNSSSVEILHQRVGSTTVEDTSNVMQTANIVHLACHGIQDVSDASQSGFCLGDGRLTIAKLMELKLDDAFLAFLSACETAKGDKTQPDQAMHLAAAMLFSGFKSVVATMWAICDVDGPKVAKWFYEELLAKEVVDGDSVAYALDFAAGNLRDSGVSVERWAPFIHMGA